MAFLPLYFLTQLVDQSLSPFQAENIKTGTLEQFVKNASESPQRCKVLRVIHAPSNVMQKLPFATEYLAWHETQSFMYCKDESNSIISLL
jgi:hypothetical protein